MKSTPVDWKNVRMDDAFWSPKIAVAREVTIPFQWEVLNDRVEGAAKSGAVRNFRIAAGLDKGEFYGCVFQDSDLAKWIEAVGYSLGTHPDERLRRIADELIDVIAAAQDPNGYLDTAFTVKDRDKRWTNLRDWHELYCMGHMMEGAVAYYRGTGNRKLLDVMSRAADHIAGVLGREEGKKRGYPGHEEIELALVKMYRATGERKYLDLSRYFLDERGAEPWYFGEEAKARQETAPTWWCTTQRTYAQSHMPVRKQSQAVGHVVRAMYLYSGMADVAYETGDKELLAACKRLWRDVTGRKMYVTGGLGSSGAAGEAFTQAYELPNESAYTETCASIGLVFWARRMLALEADRAYADVMELALYNGVLSGISQDGRGFFYSNPLESIPGSGVDGRRAGRRSPWMGCACCPPNILRLLTSLGGYLYSQADREAFVHLYVAGQAELQLAGRKLAIEQQTGYPWTEQVTIKVQPESPTAFALSLRIPGWCRKPSLKVNGKAVALGPITKKGYARIRRTWAVGDTVELTLPMPAERLWPHPKIRHTAGRVALRRGPVVYCLEQADNGPDLASFHLPDKARLEVVTDRRLFGGIPVITAAAKKACLPAVLGRKDDLYRPVRPAMKPARIKAIPYFLWANRTEGEMLVWMPSLPA